MPLTAGLHLGPYEILAPLGAGGMGEVYRARDLRLNRDVALKILPESFTHDSERLARFRREAQILAALNHPHIGAIYGLDDANGQQFLVLELIDGEMLADRIAKGPLPVAEALAIAKQIAEALEVAHEKGIIHRDLKPANIAVTRDGNVKVLDFGLAKATEATTAASVNLANSPTLTSPAMMTSAGMILGTAAYMSPEQAKGRAADRRSDLWAFGCVLYEMLTGQKAFAGEDVSDTLASVLRAEPVWTALPADTPSSIRRLLRRCLEKTPAERQRDIGDARLDIDEALTGAAGRETEQGPAPAMGLRHTIPWAEAGVLAVIAIALGAALWRFTRPVEATPQPVVRLDLDLGPDVSLGSGTGPSVILSPDGTRLVFVSQGPDGTRRLLTRRLDQPKATRLSGTEGGSAPFFSPDGQWVGFFAQGKLKKTRLEGGEPVSLCDAPAGRGASWGEDGHIVATLDTQAGLSQVSPEGGAPIPLTELVPERIPIGGRRSCPEASPSCSRRTPSTATTIEPTLRSCL